MIDRLVGLSLYLSKKETKSYISGYLCLTWNVLLCFLGVEQMSSDKRLWQNCVWVQFVTKTLQYDEFNPAASCGKIPSGFTLRWSCFQWLRVDWETGSGLHVLTHITTSRWRWFLATFEKKILLMFHWKKEPFPSADGTSHPQREGEKNHRCGETRPQTCLLIHQLHWDFSVCAGKSERDHGFARVLTTATPHLDGFTIKVTFVRDSLEGRCDKSGGFFRDTLRC